MISDLRAAEFCAALYGMPTARPVEFDKIDDGDGDGVVWAIAREDDVDTVVLRGSVTPEDWLRDSFATPYRDPTLGPVHHGFYLGMRNVWSDVVGLLRPDARLVVTGHSLGAARAAILAGVALGNGTPVAARIVFGEPKPGFRPLADFCRCVPTRSYRNGVGVNHDLVTDLPLTIPRFGLHYERQVAVTVVDQEPDPGDLSGLFVYHHFHLYLAAMMKGGAVSKNQGEQ